MSSVNKDDIINKVDRRYLEKVSDSVNNATRTDFHSYGEDAFENYVRNKFSVSELKKIWQHYMLHNPSYKPAERIRERSASDLISIYKSEFEQGDFFIENRINGTCCDLVHVTPNCRLHAIEVKSNGDDLRRASSQCQRYSEWANQVILLCETDKREEAIQELPSWVGVISIDSTELVHMREAKTLEHSINHLLNLMTVPQLKEVLLSIDKPTEGRKETLLERAEEHQEQVLIDDVREILVAN